MHSAETYREAAKEHVALAVELHNELQAYAPAHFLAGLAVECVLRAYRAAVDPVFEGRHDLRALVREARLYACVPEDEQAVLAADLQEVWRRWRNDHRYRPARMLRNWLREQGLDQRVRGDRLKYSSGVIVNAALRVVQTGERAWPF